MSCCCFVLCSRWKGRGKSCALAGRCGQRGKGPVPAVENCAIEWGSAPSRSADREEKKEAREEGGKTRRLLPENGLLFAKSSEEIRKSTRG